MGMQLTFEVGYEDYSDTAHWLPRLRELEAVFDSLARAQAAEAQDSALLETMEQLAELMAYYASTLQFEKLEPVMRKQQELLGLGAQRGLHGIGYQYLDMEFERLNGLLYAHVGQNRQAQAQCRIAAEKAERCFRLLATADELSDMQKTYVGWHCTEICQEAAGMAETLMDAQNLYTYGVLAKEMADWLEPYMEDAPGLRDKAAWMLGKLGCVLYQLGRPQEGQECCERSVRMHRKLAKDYASDFWLARAVWVKSRYGLQELVCRGSMEPMLECEQEAESLMNAMDSERDKAILQAAVGLIELQKGTVHQMKDELSEALACMQSGCSILDDALRMLEADSEGHGDYYRSVITEIGATVFQSYLGGLNGLGLILYCAGRYEEARTAFLRNLELMADPKYWIAASGIALLKGGAYQYLAAIAANDNNAEEAIFYAEQAVAHLDGLAAYLAGTQPLQLEITCCSILAELYLAQRNKPKALEYAQKGLELCEKLRRQEPGNEVLDMERLLEKYKKRAGRRFF